MDTLAAMRVFVAVVDAEGFSAASRALGMPLPTVSRKIAELESHLGAQLLTRSTRKVAVTDSGQRYYEDARHILDAVGDAESQVSGEYRQPKGRLAITAPTLFGRLHVLPIASQFMRLHPATRIEIFLSNHVTDLLEEHVNVGIRIGALSDSSMIAVQLGSVRLIVCGSPDYLARHGCPDSPDDLPQHQCTLFSKGSVPSEWKFKTPRKAIHFVPRRAPLMINSIEGVVESAVQGDGLIQMYSYQIAHHVAAGRLRVVLDHYEIEPVPVHLIRPPGRFTPQNVRAFTDFAIPLLRERLELVDEQCKT